MGNKKEKRSQGIDYAKLSKKYSYAQQIRALLILVVFISSAVYFFNRSGNQTVNIILTIIAATSAVGISFINAREKRK